MAIDAIDAELRPASLMRVGLDQGAVAEFIEAFDELPPVVPDFGGYCTIDGVHRIAAARRSGRATVRARVLKLDYAEAFRRACHANERHGVRPTQADRRRRAEEALKAFRGGRIGSPPTWPG